jgi:hypothetical protein
VNPAGIPRRARAPISNNFTPTSFKNFSVTTMQEVWELPADGGGLTELVSFDGPVSPTERMRLLGVLAIAGLVAGVRFVPLASAQAEPRIPSADSVPARLSFDCAWHPQAPATERVLVDLVFRRLEADPRHLPTPAEVEAVRRAGGAVRHRFRVPMVRAELDTTAVRQLITGPGAVATFARTVPDPRAFEVVAQIRYDRVVRVSDLLAIERLGGQEQWTVPRPHIIAVALPDSVVPRVRRLPGVRSIEPFTVGCSVSDVDAGMPLSDLPPSPVPTNNSLSERSSSVALHSDSVEHAFIRWPLSEAGWMNERTWPDTTQVQVLDGDLVVRGSFPLSGCSVLPRSYVERRGSELRLLIWGEKLPSMVEGSVMTCPADGNGYLRRYVISQQAPIAFRSSNTDARCWMNR